MPIRDVAAQVASLQNDYGSTHGPHSPASFELAIFVGDPMNGGHEMPSTTNGTANGYAPATVTNDGTNFPAPDATTGELTTPGITFAASTAEWPEVGTHWLLRDPATGNGWDCAAFEVSDRIDVTDAGQTPNPVLSIFYNDLTA